MSITRAPRPESNFYVLNKSISEDRRLSWAARGMLIYLLGKPDHWKVSIAALINETGEAKKPTGRDGVYTIINELLAAGYLMREPQRDGGRFGGDAYQVSESPHRAPPDTEKPDTVDSPDTAQPDTAKPTQAKTDPKQGKKEATPLTPFGGGNTDRGTRLPADWTPSAEEHDFARSLGLNPEKVAERFRDYWCAKSGRDALKADWSATWRNWCRRDANDAPARRSTSSENRRSNIDVLFGRRRPSSTPPARGPIIDAES